MLTKEAIDALAQAQAIDAANKATMAAPGTAALPSDYQMHDLEKFLPFRRRLRGHMDTSVLADFAEYVKANKEAGARVFVNQADMKATAVLNIGTPDLPGHADNTATFKPLATAAYKALRQIATGQPLKQIDVAEFLEDWFLNVQCSREGVDMTTTRSLSGIRAISIEKLQRAAATEQQLSATRSTFESVKAEGEDIPTHIQFKAVPFQGLTERAFNMRLAILTGDKVPAITLRIVKAEEHAEQMAAELASLVRGAIVTDVPVLIGSYVKS